MKGARAINPMSSRWDEGDRKIKKGSNANAVGQDPDDVQRGHKLNRYIIEGNK